MNIPLLIFIFIIFIIILISYAIKGIDFVAISLLSCFIAAAITGFLEGKSIGVFIGYI